MHEQRVINASVCAAQCLGVIDVLKGKSGGVSLNSVQEVGPGHPMREARLL